MPRANRAVGATTNRETVPIEKAAVLRRLKRQLLRASISLANDGVGRVPHPAKQNVISNCASAL
jgi:hypothetical protein